MRLSGKTTPQPWKSDIRSRAAVADLTRIIRDKGVWRMIIRPYDQRDYSGLRYAAVVGQKIFCPFGQREYSGLGDAVELVGGTQNLRVQKSGFHSISVLPVTSISLM